MQPKLTDLPYQPNALLNLFASLSNQPWSMLLHSGHNKHIGSHFDILVSSPTITLVTRGGITEICQDKYRKLSTADPFKLLEEQLNLADMSADINERLPFQGGAIGLFGYDLARRIEILPELAQQRLNLPDMAIGLYRWALISDHQRNKLTLVTHDDPSPLLKKFKESTKTFTPFRLLGPWKSNMTRAGYNKKFQKIQEYLQKGDCYQICLAQQYHAPFCYNEWPAFRYLLAHNRAPFSAFIRLKNKQSLLSFSPERFLHLRDYEIQTQPIKGTLPRLTDPTADRQQAINLANSPKDKAENIMIVDLLRNDIGRVALPGSVQVPSLFAIKTFPAVHHMVSTITATLPRGRSACDLLRACFPGGSITGAPKVHAMKILEQLEPHRRNAWGGSIGYISCCGTMDTNIAIRTLIAEQGNIYCPVGSGIVADSDEETEYQETLAKIATLLPLLTHFNI